MRKVVVAGADGFIGTAITEKLSDSGAISLYKWGRGNNQEVNSSNVDLTDDRMLESMLGELQPLAVINAAGRVNGSPAALYRDNAGATASIALAILKASPRTVLIQLGSAAEYGRPNRNQLLTENAACRPISIYGHTKLAAANYLFYLERSAGLRLNYLRVFNPIGISNSPNQVVGAFMMRAIAARDSGQISMGPMHAIRDFFAIDDLAKLTLQLIEKDISGQVVNVCSGEGRLVRDIIQMLVQSAPFPINVFEKRLETSIGEDRVVGDPTRFLALSGLVKSSPIEEILRRSWNKMLLDASMDQR